MTRFQHCADYVVAGVIGLIIINNLLPWGGSLEYFLVTLFSLILAIKAWLAMRIHNRGMCDICLLSTPVNAKEIAAKYQKSFIRLHRFGESKSISSIYLAFIIVVQFMLSVPFGIIIWTPAMLSLIYLIWLNRTHRHYIPWCVKCANGGLGEKVPEKDLVLS